MPEILNAEQVIATCEAMRDDPSFSEWRILLENWRALRHGKAGISLPGVPELLEERSALVQTHGLRYVNRLDSAKLKLEETARSAKPSAAQSALNAEAFDYALYYDFRAQPDDPYRRRTDGTVYNIGIMHLAFKSNIRSKLFREKLNEPGDLVKALAEKKFTENPFVVESPSVAATFWERDFSSVCEIGEQPIAHWFDAAYDDATERDDAFKHFTSETLPEGSGRLSTVKHYHLETPERIYDVLDSPGERGNNSIGDSTMLEHRPTLIGEHWYTFAIGNLTSDDDPDEQYVPVIHAVYRIVNVINILETLVNSGALQTGRNMWQEVRVGAPIRNFLDIVADKNYEQQPDITVDTLEEMLPPPKDGHEWKPVQVPDQSQLVTALQNKKEELLDQGFPIALLPGQPEQQRASSGYQAANEMGAAITQLDPPLRNIANADRNLFTKIHGIIKALDVSVELPVHQHGDRSTPSEVITIKPEDLGEVDMTVTYESIPEAAKFAMIEELRRQVKDGHTPKSKLMAFLHDDPIRAQDLIDREAIAASMTQMAAEDAAAIVQELRGPAMRQIAAEEGFPLPGGGEAGGPAPGQDERRERPVGGGFPGLGGPKVPPPQTQPGQTVPADVNTALVGETGGQ